MRSMTDGPSIQYGNDNPQQRSNPDAGPNVDFQGNALIDSRFAINATAPPSAWKVPAWFGTSSLELLNIVPQTAGAAVIAAGQTTTAGGALALVSANSAGIQVNIPIVPFGTAIQPSAPTVSTVAIGLGNVLVTTTAGSAQIVVTGPAAANNTTLLALQPGQKVIVAGAGNAGGTLPLFATVLATPFRAVSGQAIQAANTFLLSSNALASLTNAAVGSADPLYGISAYPQYAAGAVGVWDPSQLMSRVLSYTAGAAAAGTITVTGYDIYNQLMHETVTLVSSTTTNGQKAFKYIVSAVASAVNANNVSIGVADLFGYPVRSDLWEFTNSFYAQAFLTSPTSYVPAALATPSFTTGDVRGTIGIPSASNGSNRLVIYGNPNFHQCVAADNIVPYSLSGLTQA
jgi:hypothetical protein